MFNTKHELTISEIKKRAQKTFSLFTLSANKEKLLKNKQKLITDDDQRRVKQANLLNKPKQLLNKTIPNKPSLVLQSEASMHSYEF